MTSIPANAVNQIPQSQPEPIPMSAPAVEPDLSELPAEAVPVESLAGLLERERQRGKTDRLWAVCTVGVMMLAGLLLVLSFNRSLSAHAATAAELADRVTKQQTQLTAMQNELAQTRSELQMANLWLERAQTTINNLERFDRNAPRKPGNNATATSVSRRADATR